MSNTIILRNRNKTIKSTKDEKIKKLHNLFTKTTNTHNRIKKIMYIKKLFEFYTKNCSRDIVFRKPDLLKIIIKKLNEFSLLEDWGIELSRNYMNRIFPRSARFEYLLFRKKTQNGIIENKKRRKNIITIRYISWTCMYSPIRSFRIIMDFIGPYLIN